MVRNARLMVIVSCLSFLLVVVNTPGTVTRTTPTISTLSGGIPRMTSALSCCVSTTPKRIDGPHPCLERQGLGRTDELEEWMRLTETG